MIFIRKKIWPLLYSVLFAQSSYTQTSSSETAYLWFDSQMGREVTSLNNGPIFYDTYRTADKNNFRYFKNEYLKGNVTYDSQKYYDVYLKYDLFKDALLYQPEGSAYAINLIKEKVAGFSIDGKEFINESFEKNTGDRIEGYVERNLVSEKFIFYIKYSKKIREKVKENSSLSEFRSEDIFLVYSNGTYTQVSSKKEVSLLFPEYKTKIYDFYLMNKNLLKLDTTQFMKNLFAYINQITIKNLLNE